MSFDPTCFASASVVDTCAVWNILSSKRLYQAAIHAQRHFCVTPMVLYECLQKPRSNTTEEQTELMGRLRVAQTEGYFPAHECTLDDLLAISAKAPGKLGSGELSCIATAYRIQSIAFMTDESLARTSAGKIFGLRVETTPRLYGFLHYHLHLDTSDHENVIAEHEKYERRPLTKFLRKTYEIAMRSRLMNNSAALATKPSPI